MLNLDFLKRPRIEALALRGYRQERIAELSLPITLGVMEGGFIGVIADKLFQVHPAVLALLSAAPMFGNLSSFFWARVAHGRRKVPLIVTLQAVFVALVASIALVPPPPLGTWILVGVAVIARLVLGGVVTVRSLIWTLNYPRAHRSRVISRLAVMSTLTISITVLLGSLVLDGNPEAFRALYLTAAVCGAVGVFAFARVPVLNEDRQLELERAGVAESDQVQAAPRSRSAFRVLRQDPNYARYLSWQFLLGVANMMVEPSLLYLVSNQLQASYTYSIAVTVGLPFGLTVLTVPLWAPYLDRVHIAQFRARHSWLFAISQGLLCIGAAQGSLLLIALARTVVGIARGGGILAWQLGHNDFADQERVGLYMGIHVSLTGLRGLIAPFAGMGLYLGWDALQFGGVSLPAFSGIGAALMGTAAALSVVASLGFLALHWRIERERAAHHS